MSSVLHCAYSSQCSGCDWIHLSYEEQVAAKKDQFSRLLSLPNDIDMADKVTFKSFAPQGLRDRLDFVLGQGKMGLYQKGPMISSEKASRGVVDIDLCHQLSPELQSFYTDFRKIHWPVTKGSFRLRVSPTGRRGAWLDFSNVDIKNLLDEKASLAKLQELAFVEMGQRHKSVIQKKDGQWGLGTPEYQTWLQTHHGNRVIDLDCTVGSFTQPSHITNHWITKELATWFSDLKPQNVLEFGSGIGNLSFPALSCESTSLVSLEVAPLAAEAQRISLKKYGLLDRVDLRVGDFRLKKAQDISQVDILLVNPARNGVGQLFQNMTHEQMLYKARNIFYMSCYPESFALDTQFLVKSGYSLEKAILIDQFPQTHHVEILSRWSLG